MDRLWAPWRMQYIEKVDDGDECFLCARPQQHDDEKNHIIHRAELVFVILNAFPYSNGHLMVAPYRHTGDLLDLSDEELAAMMSEARLCTRLLTAAMSPQGFNLGINIGRIAGAGVADHLHLHIVPRWSGDTNFMPVIGNTKVLPQALDETYRLLRRTLNDINSGR